MKNFQNEGLSHCPIHGYIPFISAIAHGSDEVAEREILDHAWVQRMRQIHQLQTAWWVYPTAEHTRFQHIIGVMHLASRAVARLYESLAEVCEDLPSRGYIDCLMRMSALLHDVGHGPFGHFFDAYFLRDYGLNHETLGATIIENELGDLLRRVRRSPNGELNADETLDPRQMTYLITRPKKEDEGEHPRWLTMLRSLFCGIYTVDNLDFVLRDAFMSGYSERSYDLERLLHYSFFSPQGLTIHQRGMSSLLRFMQTRVDLFRTVYFHRTVRAIDLSLRDLFIASKSLLFPVNPLEDLAAYQRFTEWSLLIDVANWDKSDDPQKKELAPRWREFLDRRLLWRAICERNLVFQSDDSESSSIFSDEETLLLRLRKNLSPELSALPLQVDLPRHIHRPHALAATAGQNYLYLPAHDEIRPLTDDKLYQRMPLAGRTCRIYASPETSQEIVTQVAAALDQLIGSSGADDVTNM